MHVKASYRQVAMDVGGSTKPVVSEMLLRVTALEKEAALVSESAESQMIKLRESIMRDVRASFRQVVADAGFLVKADVSEMMLRVTALEKQVALMSESAEDQMILLRESTMRDVKASFRQVVTEVGFLTKPDVTEMMLRVTALENNATFMSASVEEQMLHLRESIMRDMRASFRQDVADDGFSRTPDMSGIMLRVTALENEVADWREMMYENVDEDLQRDSKEFEETESESDQLRAHDMCNVDHDLKHNRQVLENARPWSKQFGVLKVSVDDWGARLSLGEHSLLQYG